jgi:hypothetical protein
LGFISKNSQIQEPVLQLKQAPVKPVRDIKVNGQSEKERKKERNRVIL